MRRRGFGARPRVVAPWGPCRPMRRRAMTPMLMGPMMMRPMMVPRVVVVHNQQPQQVHVQQVHHVHHQQQIQQPIQQPVHHPPPVQQVPMGQPLPAPQPVQAPPPAPTPEMPANPVADGQMPSGVATPSEPYIENGYPVLEAQNEKCLTCGLFYNPMQATSHKCFRESQRKENQLLDNVKQRRSSLPCGKDENGEYMKLSMIPLKEIYISAWIQLNIGFLDRYKKIKESFTNKKLNFFEHIRGKKWANIRKLCPKIKYDEFMNNLGKFG